MTDRVFRAQRVVLPDGERPADVVVSDGRIDAVLPWGQATGNIVDIGELALLPGLVDTHVHVNEPGRTQWEGFASATRAAAAGGVTTLIDMPLNSIPPTTTVEHLEVKRAAARGSVHVDVGFWGGAIGSNTGDLKALHEAGVFGFKSFLSPSGVDEFPHLVGDQLDDVLAETARLRALSIVHAEDPAVLGGAPPARGRSYEVYLLSRPDASEVTAVERLLDAVRRSGARVHVLHVSSRHVLPVLDAARREGLAVTAETCPHYLMFAAERVPDGATAFKCCPPIRDTVNQDGLWRGLATGTLDMVVSDHSPSTADVKALDTGDFGAAWGGIAGLQLGLSAVWSEASARGVGLVDVVRWMSSAPASLVGLGSKGAIAVGRDADLVAFDPDATFEVDPWALHHRNPVTPYAGTTLRGVVRSTWLRGEVVDGEKTRGALLERGSR